VESEEGALSVHFVSPLEVTMLRDVACVGTQTKLPIKRSSRAAVERCALGVPANASIDVVSDALDDTPIKAQEPMLHLGRLTAHYIYIYHQHLLIGGDDTSSGVLTQ
jgi:hypothetical protein